MLLILINTTPLGKPDHHSVGEEEEEEEEEKEEELTAGFIEELKLVEISVDTPFSSSFPSPPLSTATLVASLNPTSRIFLMRANDTDAPIPDVFSSGFIGNEEEEEEEEST
jgi:hypothetical protein